MGIIKEKATDLHRIFCVCCLVNAAFAYGIRAHANCFLYHITITELEVLSMQLLQVKDNAERKETRLHLVELLFVGLFSL